MNQNRADDHLLKRPEPPGYTQRSLGTAIAERDKHAELQLAKSRLPYREGTWFGVPLDDRAFAIGLIARMHKGGRVLLGYFFGPRTADLPSLDEVSSYSRSDAALTCMFGDLALFKNWWPIIGHQEDFRRSDWPIPVFVRGDDEDLSLVEYDDDDLLSERSLVKVTGTLSGVYPRDALSGYEAVQIKLSRLL